MGSEAIGSVTITDANCTLVAHAHDVKLLLESREVILRGALKRVMPIASLSEVEVVGERLRFCNGDEVVELTLGGSVARRWATKILTPPPTLADKLGISPERPPLVIGRVTDARLIEALLATSPEPSSALGEGTGAVTASPVAASPVAANSVAAHPDQIAVAEVDDSAALDQALNQLPGEAAIWIVHRKGKGVDFGDAAVRERMRSLGFVDTKVSAVSDTRTATRYIRRRPSGEPRSD